MDMNIIKEYLVSLGVKIKEDSFNQFEKTMSNTEKTMKNFAENNKEKMGSMKKFFTVFNSSLKDNMEIISLIIPGIETPLHQVIGLAELLYKGITKVSRGFKEIKTDNLKNTDIKEISKEVDGVSKKTKENQMPVRQLVDLVRELNVEISKLSGEVNNVNLNRLNGQEDIEKSSESIKDFSIKAEEAKKPIVGLISLIKELNVQMSKLSSFSMPKIVLKGDTVQALKGINKISEMLVVLNNRTDEFASKLKNINISDISIKAPKIPETKESQEKLNKVPQNTENINGKTRENNLYINQAMDLYKKLELGINKLIENLKNIKIPRDNLTQQNSQIPNKENKNNFKNDFVQSPTYIENTSKALKALSKNSENANDSIKLLAEGGSKSLKGFAQNVTKFLGVVAVAVAGIVTVAVSSWKTLTSMANQDLEYQKLAMQLWTTKENAKEVDMALKTMKISMQDLWLSPELLQQFNQLRQDSSKLKLPADAEDKLKLVRSIVFEFKRLKQAGSLAFQWIGYYISKYAGGPLADIHQTLNKFVNWILKNIPVVAKIIGSTLGIAFRLILDTIEAIGFVLKPVISLTELLGKVFNDLPGPVKSLIEGLGKVLVFVLAGPLLLLDDLLTALRGGKSVIGSFFDKFKEGANAIKDIKNGWNSFWGGIENFIDKIREKVKKLIKEIKDIPLVKGINDIKNLPGDIKSKVEGFAGSVKKGASSIKSYILPQSNTVNNKNSTSTQTNHNNTTNNFNIYGTNATSTANAVNNKINNGIKTRNLQGVIG